MLAPVLLFEVSIFENLMAAVANCQKQSQLQLKSVILSTHLCMFDPCIAEQLCNAVFGLSTGADPELEKGENSKINDIHGLLN